MGKQIEDRQRMTTDNPQTNVYVMLNYAYAKDGRVFLRYADGEKDIDLCDYVSRKAADFHCKPTPKEVMEGECMECDCPLAILYVVATQAAELRARLKEFEDREENKGEQSEGEWESYYDGYRCPCCKEVFKSDMLFIMESFPEGKLPGCCPNCGAKMKGGEG